MSKSNPHHRHSDTEWSRNGHFNAENHDNLQMNHFSRPEPGGCEGREEVEAVERVGDQDRQLSTFMTHPTQALGRPANPKVPSPAPLTPTTHFLAGNLWANFRTKGEEGETDPWKRGPGGQGRERGGKLLATVATLLEPSTKQSWALEAQEGTTPLPSLPAGGRATEHKHRAKRGGEGNTGPGAEVWEGVV